MRPSRCSREDELLTQMATGHPLDSALQAHVRACAACSELMALVQVLRFDAAAAAGEPSLPTASQVWWRARVRSRLEAAQVADRPISIAQSLSVAALAGLAVSLLNGHAIVNAAHYVEMFLDGGKHQAAATLLTVASASPLGWALFVACGVVAVLMPLIALVAASGD